MVVSSFEQRSPPEENVGVNAVIAEALAKEIVSYYFDLRGGGR